MFKSTLTNGTIDTCYYSSESQAYKSMAALYNQESLAKSGRFCNDYENILSKQNPVGNLITKINGGFKFAVEVLKMEMRKDIKKGKFNHKKWYTSEMAQMIFEEALRELKAESFFKGDNEESEERIKKHETEIKRLTDENIQLKRKCDNQKKMEGELQKREEELQKKIEALNAETKQLAIDKENLGHQAAQYKADVDLWKNKYETENDRLRKTAYAKIVIACDQSE